MATATATVLLIKTLLDSVSVGFSVLRELPLLIPQLFSGLLGFIGLYKRKKPWGTVFDSVTKEPIDPAIVTLYEGSDTTKKTEQRITDMKGRFDFLVRAGTYCMGAVKTDYTFPSKILSGKKEIDEYSNLYFGEPLNFSDKDIVTVNIPMDAQRYNWNQANKPKYYHRNFRLFREGVLRIIAATGIFLALIAYILSPTVWNLSILFVYAAIIILRTLFIKEKNWGVVFDSKTHKMLPRMKITSVKNIAGRELSGGNTITDIYGRYFLRLEEGEQMLMVEKENPDGSYELLKRFGPYKIKSNNTDLNPDLEV